MKINIKKDKLLEIIVGLLNELEYQHSGITYEIITLNIYMV